MEFIRRSKRQGFVVVKRDSSSELHFDEKTGTVRIIVNRNSSGTRVVAATPVIMSRRVRRDIKKGDAEKSDEKRDSKMTACGV